MKTLVYNINKNKKSRIFLSYLFLIKRLLYGLHKSFKFKNSNFLNNKLTNLTLFFILSFKNNIYEKEKKKIKNCFKRFSKKLLNKEGFDEEMKTDIYLLLNIKNYSKQTNFLYLKKKNSLYPKILLIKNNLKIYKKINFIFLADLFYFYNRTLKLKYFLDIISFEFNNYYTFQFNKSDKILQKKTNFYINDMNCYQNNFLLTDKRFNNKMSYNFFFGSYIHKFVLIEDFINQLDMFFFLSCYIFIVQKKRNFFISAHYVNGKNIFKFSNGMVNSQKFKRSKRSRFAVSKHNIKIFLDTLASKTKNTDIEHFNIHFKKKANMKIQSLTGILIKKLSNAQQNFVLDSSKKKNKIKTITSSTHMGFGYTKLKRLKRKKKRLKFNKKFNSFF